MLAKKNQDVNTEASSPISFKEDGLLEKIKKLLSSRLADKMAVFYLAPAGTLT